MQRRYWLETLGCPKNQVDSDKLAGLLAADGLVAASSPDTADLVVVNTCAFIEAARQESIDTVLALSDARRPGAQLVVTGCLAERYGEEVTDALPEVDAVAGFADAVPVTLGRKKTSAMHTPTPEACIDLLHGDLSALLLLRPALLERRRTCCIRSSTRITPKRR